MPQLDPEKQREFAIEVVRRLRDRGFEALWAGGCVRDFVLGRIPKDYDVATTARPEEIRDVFGQRRTVAVGAAFGVIAVLGPEEAGQIDVATFRQDIGYSDSRHPDAVEFSTPQADAQRRDFTINGLFYDPLAHGVIDYVGGQADLAGGIVRAIGDPLARFAEDKLRLLRAVRFTATFGFELETATRQAICEMAAEVTRVSSERIAAELRRMLIDDSRTRAVRLLDDAGLLKAILPELSTVGNDWLFTLKVLDKLDLPTFPLALATLLHSLTPEVVYEICRRWKLSNHDTQTTRWLVANQNVLVEAREMAWSRLQRILISDGIDELLELHDAVAWAADSATAHVEHCRRLLEMPREELDPAPLLTGNDLISHGVRRGKQYQQLLEAVRDAQLDGKITTKTEALALVDQLLRSNIDT